MNAAFQDCLRLASCLSAHEDQRDALKDYNATQLPDGDAIGTLSLSNFIEMRDKTASPLFRCIQRIRKQLSMNFPSLYMPRYNLVSFTTMPYADVIRHVALRRILVSAFILGGMAIFILIVLLLLGTI
jgi:kynurenine 3-monooxygenase